MKISHFQQPSQLWRPVLNVRIQVFVDELLVPADLEEDEFDKMATHFYIKKDDQIIATLRLVKQEGTIKVGRLAVLPAYRRQGVATALMNAAIDYSQQALQANCITLGAQCYVENFYQQLGFESQGEIFLDAGIPHITMIKQCDV